MTPRTLEIPYGDAPSQFGRLHLPDRTTTPGSPPVLVVVHGGYWKASKSLDNYPTTLLVEHYAERVAVWNVEYRRMGEPGGGWPGTFLDAAAALDLVPRLAEEHDLDAGRVTVVGHSAGGQLALWLASRPRIAPGSPLWRAEPFVPHAAVSIGGIPDLALAWRGGLGNATILPRLLGSPPQERPEAYAATSPIELLPAACPVTLVHGTLDVDVVVEQSRSYARAAAETGADVELVELARADHFTMLARGTAEWRGLVKALARRAPELG